MYSNLRQKTHYSLLNALPKCNQVVDYSKKLGYKSSVMTDRGTISGAIDFFQQCKKKEIKPILGCDFSTTKSQTEYGSFVLLAKNKQGWINIIKAVSLSNDEDYFYYKPTIPVEELAKYSENNVVFTGGVNSELYKSLIEGNSIKPDAEQIAIDKINYYRTIFHEVFIEIQRFTQSNLLIYDIIESAANKCNVKCIATPDPYYLSKDNADDFRLLLCSNMKTTLSKVNYDIKHNNEISNKDLMVSNNYFIPSIYDMKNSYQNEELLRNTELIDSMIEKFDITNKPKLPHFQCPDNMSESDYLKELCRIGWKNKILNKIKDSEIDTYKNRVLKELSVFDDASLAGYFLIVKDYVNWAKSQGYLCGPGRGSGGGCLTSYLLGITGIDPIRYGLMFERFYNSGRNTKDHISYPDIDVDFPLEAKENVINYLKDKYGKNRVCQLVTFGRLMGASALKEVLRIHSACDFEMMNEITRNIPDEASIADKLEEDKEDSIISWVIHNEPEVLAKWCKIDDNGNITGEIAEYVKQAIRLEGTFKNSSKHAAAVVISNEELDTFCPMIRDKSKKGKIAGYEMDSLEAAGGIKFDVLSVASLSKCQMVQEILEGKSL